MKDGLDNINDDKLKVVSGGVNSEQESELPKEMETATIKGGKEFRGFPVKGFGPHG